MEPSGVRRFDWMPADLDLIRRLFGCCRLRCHRHHRHVDAALGFGAELNVTSHEREQGVIAAQADIAAGMPLGAALARQNVARDDALAAENLDSKALAVRIAAVTGRAACFFVGHRGVPEFALILNLDLCRNHHFLLAFRVAGLAAFLAAFGLPLALLLRGASSASPASPPATASPGAGLGFARRTLSVMVGAWPSVRISVIRTKVNSGRKPRLRREFFRRRFLNAMIFGPRPCWSTSAATEAPAMVGVPSVTLSPPTTRTSPNCTISPGSPLSRSILSMSWAATRYCLPPVFMTANIVLVLVFDPGVRRCPDRLLPVG